MNPGLDLFGKNRFDIALNCYYKKGDVFAPCLIGSFYFAGRGGTGAARLPYLYPF
jgi:hypothetical protein